ERRTATTTAATAAGIQHLHLIADDFGSVAILTVLALPFAGLQTPLYIHLAALAQIFAGDFRQPREEHHAVPLRALLHFTALLVAPGIRGRDPDISHGRAACSEARFRIRAEIADDDDFVDAARCHIVPFQRPPGSP